MTTNNVQNFVCYGIRVRFPHSYKVYRYHLRRKQGERVVRRSVCVYQVLGGVGDWIGVVQSLLYVCVCVCDVRMVLLLIRDRNPVPF
jgi:hypothetical protein